MSKYKIIGIDLAKTKFHIAALDEIGKVVFKKAISRKDFINQLGELFEPNQTFAFEACGGCHYIGQFLTERGHKIIVLKPKDVKAYAKSRQKNDMNDAIGICKAALDPELKKVQLKSKAQQEIAYFHKSRQNVIRQRIQRSNGLMTSLQEFGFIVSGGKTRFAKNCVEYIEKAYQGGYIKINLYKEMLKDCEEIKELLEREKSLDKLIISYNAESKTAQLLETIPGIGPINASVLSNKSMEGYEKPRDFAASLGLVPKQSTTGGKIKLGRITKQGDRYARTMLIQGARSVVMRSCKENPPKDNLYNFIIKLRGAGKNFNVICVAVANKLARIAYSCATRGIAYRV